LRQTPAKIIHTNIAVAAGEVSTATFAAVEHIRLRRLRYPQIRIHRQMAVFPDASMRD
jgi:hypothetical protein